MKTTRIRYISIILALIILLSFYPCAAFGGLGGYLSSSTSVLANGVVNDSVSVVYYTVSGGFPEKTEWASLFTTTVPIPQAWNSHLSIGQTDGGFMVSFQRQGLGQFIPWTRFFGGR